MSKIVHLHNIRVRSLLNPHVDLPPGMKVIAQLIVDGTIIQQTMPVDSEYTHDSLSWKLRFDCEITPHAPTFRIAVIRKARGSRLLGSVEIAGGEAILSGEQRRPFRVPLEKVNSDGPLLDLSAAFSISFSTTESSGRGRNNIPQINIGSVNTQAISNGLGQMFDDTKRGHPLETQELCVMHERILLLPTSTSDRGRFLNVLGDVCLQQWNTSHIIEDLNQAVCAYDDAGRDGLEDTNSLLHLCVALRQRVDQFGDIGDMTKCVSVMQEVIRVTPDSHPDKPSRLSNLGIFLLTRFERLGDLGDLNESILMGETAVHLTPDGHPDKPSMWNNLAHSLARRFERLDNLDDLEKFVSMQEDAVRLTPDGDPDKGLKFHNLGISLRTRFERFGDLGDLTKSVLMGENAVRLTPDSHSNKPAMLGSLGASLFIRFERLGDLGDLNKSVSMGEAAIRLTPRGHPAEPGRLSNLSIALRIRYERLGDLGDLNNLVLIGEDALRLTPDGHPNKPTMLDNVGNSLLRRFERIGDLGDLDRSVLMGQNAIRLTPDDHPNKRSMLNNLGNTLRARFQRLGHVDDLDKFVQMQEKTVRMTPNDHPDKPARLHNLASSLRARFEWLDDLGDLNQSVSTSKDALRLTPDGHPDKPARLDNLGNSLIARFERLGDLDDLNKSVQMGESAVHLAADDDPTKPIMLNNLGMSFARRFQRLGDLADLNKSVSMPENAVRLTPAGHPNKASILHNFGLSLLHRFQRLGDVADIHKSVSAGEEAVSLTPDGDAGKPSSLSHLGNSLLTRFKSLGDLGDLNRAVLMGQDAVGLTPDGHPDKPSRLSNLAASLSARFQYLGDPADLQQIILHFTSAARSRTGPVTIRFHAASRWAYWARIMQSPSVMDAYNVALDLLPQLAWLGLSISDRHHHVLKAGEMVRNAAAAAIASGQPEKAVEWLEQGRSVIWGQLLDLRTPVDTLNERHPELAKQLLSLSAQLEKCGTRVNEQIPIDSGTQQSLQSIADQAHRNALARDQLLKRIRNLEGFDRFLLPKTISELSKAVQGGPVIILNVSDTGGDALALMPNLDGEVMHISLPNLTPEHAETLGRSLGTLVHHPGRNERLLGTREGQLQPEDEFANILSELWIGVVKPVLDGLAITTPIKANFPRIWWCPTGPLAFLPIHAAGLYGDKDTFGSKLSDFAISSYTPSLTSLIEGFRAPAESQKPQLLAVAQPSAFGQAYIPGTKEEITCIQRLAHGKLPVLRLDEHMATVDSVQQGMRDSSWVHFACHGIQDVSHPTESALLLAGSSRLTLSHIIQLALPHADLAFLSACQTATGDKNLQEESVHLAAGILMAGYRGVIATMWSIMDNDAPQVAGDVYEHLFKTLPPDPTQAAEALHLAVRKLRESSSTKKSFLHWVPFIHVGV